MRVAEWAAQKAARRVVSKAVCSVAARAESTAGQKVA